MPRCFVCQQPDDYEGDIEMITKWADFLNLSGWFAWTGF